MRRPIAGVVVLWVVAAAVPSAVAREQCHRLPPTISGRFGGVADMQRAELLRARQQMGRCVLSLLPQCAALAATIARMEANLGRLERPSHCTARPVVARSIGPGPRLEPQPVGASWRPMAGLFRTLCVRTCDGYFWPVSTAIGSRGFERDEETCRRACPNGDVALYVQRSPGGPIEGATGRDGTPYSALANAFRYRKSYDASCACRSLVTEDLVQQESERDGRSDAAPPDFAGANLRPAVGVAPEPSADVSPRPSDAPAPDPAR